MRLRHILRRLVQLPLFTAVAVMTLAIGIGANSAIFSVVEGILLKPLPFSHPDTLVVVDHSAPGVGIASAGAAPFLYFTYRDDTRSLQDVGLWRRDTAAITGLAEPEQVVTLDVTDGVLPILGVQPMFGRSFSRQDDSPGTSETAMLTAGYWRAKFGADASVIGRRILVDGRPHDIIGVLPDTFHFLDQKPALLLPMRLDRGKTFLGNFSYSGIARLKPGVTLAQANADVSRMIPIAIHRFSPFPGYSVKMFEEARLGAALRPLKEALVGDLSKVLWVLMGTIGMVLLIACANVANLLLVRAEARQQELAIRAALGAGWGQIAKELLLESLSLGVAGGIVGLALAVAALRVLSALAPANLPRLEEISIDGPVLLFTAAISLFAGVLFGVIPVLKYAGPQLGAALRAGGRSLSQSRERHRARNTLVVVQVALALVLLISSGLMIRTFQALKHVAPGFTRPEDIQTLQISIPESQVADPVQVVRMEQAIADRIAAIPGVSSVGLTTAIPMSGNNWTDPVYASDRVYAEGQIPPLRHYKFTSPGLLKTLGNTLVAGRDFMWTDVYEKHRVAMVSENFAREMWGDPSEAVGKRIREMMKGPWREIIGVVGDERDDGVNQKAPTIVCWPLLLDNFNGDEVAMQRTYAYMIRSQRTGTQGFVSEIGQAVWSVNPNLPLANVRTLQEVYSRSLARTSFTLVMLAIAGAMALLLGVAGIYGVISYSVTQRTREIGIRIALGARREEVTRMFVGHGLRLAVIGAACGLAASFALMRLMSALLFAVSPADPATYAAVTLSLVLAAVLASYLPALRATTVDPVDALRAE
jgi:putative ABC transport system permease protein